MSAIDGKLVQRIYKRWVAKHYPFISSDFAIEPFLGERIERGQNWLRLARNALFLSTSTLAERLEISRSGYVQLEKSEINGTISLKTLSRAADAMDCELIYAIRPKKKIRFSEVIWNTLLGTTIRKYGSLRPDDFAYRIHQLQDDRRFRRNQNWTFHGRRSVFDAD